jgi:putative protease
MAEKELGTVFDYFAKVGVAAIKLVAPLKVGDKIKIKGATTDLEQTLESMQMHNSPVEKANAGDDVGIKVNDRVRKHDKIFLVE